MKFLNPSYVAPGSRARTRFEDRTEINDVDLATRENSSASQLLLRGGRERKRRGGEAWCLLSFSQPLLRGLFGMELVFEEGAAENNALT